MARCSPERGVQSQTDLVAPRLCHLKAVCVDQGFDFVEPTSSSVNRQQNIRHEVMERRELGSVCVSAHHGPGPKAWSYVCLCSLFYLIFM